jgi:hypothetical protein
MNFPSLQIGNKGIALYASDIYFIDGTTIKKCPQNIANGTSAVFQPVIINAINPKSISVNGEHLYLVDGNILTIYNKNDYSIIRTVPLTAFKGITSSNTYLYVVDGNTVTIYNSNGTTTTLPTINVTNCKGISTTITHLYIIDGTIVKKFNPDGSSVSTIISGLSTPKGIAAMNISSRAILYIIDGTKILQYDTSVLLFKNEYSSPKALAVNDTGDCFLVDGTDIRRVSYISTALTTTVDDLFNNIGTADNTGKQFIIHNKMVKTFSSGVLTPIVPTILLGDPRGIAVNNTNLYVVDGNTVKIYPKTGSANPSATITVTNYRGITVNNTHMYVANVQTTDKVTIYNSNGSTTTIPNIDVTNFKAMTANGNNLFICDGTVVKVYSLNGSTFSRIALSDTTLFNVTSITVNTTGGSIQLVDGSNIKRYNGDNLVSIIPITNLISIINTNNTTYVMTNNGFILSYTINNSAPLNSLRNNPIIAANRTSIFLVQGIEVARYDNNSAKSFVADSGNVKSMYATDTCLYLCDTNNVRRHNVNGTVTSTSVLISGLANVNKIVLDSSFIYVTNGNKLYRFSIPDENIPVSPTPLTAISGDQALTELTNINDIYLNDDYYYVVDGNTVMIINRTTLTTIGTIPVIDLKNITATNSKLYIIDDNTMTEYDTNGTNGKIIDGLTAPTDIAVLGNKYVIDGSDIVTINKINGVSYNYVNTDVTVTAFDNSINDVEIASSIDSKPVTSIATNAFRGGLLQTITIPSSVLSIGNNACSFCPNLTNVTIR